MLAQIIERLGDVKPAHRGIRAAIQKAYRKRKLPSPEQMLKIARKWEPYRTLACYYLWRSLD